MSTYWYVDINAPLRVDEDDARQAFGQVMRNMSHRLDRSPIGFAELIADRLPFQTRDADSHPSVDLPAAGWAITGSRLHASMFVENLTRPSEDNPETGRHELLLAVLADILDMESGTIVGALASEGCDCKGPLVVVGSAIRWLESIASHPGHGYDLGPDLETIDRIPPDLLTDPGDGLTCNADITALFARTSELCL